MRASRLLTIGAVLDLVDLVLTARRDQERIVLLALTLLTVPGALPPEPAAGVPVLPVALSNVLAIGSLLIGLAAAVLTFLPQTDVWSRRGTPSPA